MLPFLPTNHLEALDAHKRDARPPIRLEVQATMLEQKRRQYELMYEDPEPHAPKAVTVMAQALHQGIASIVALFSHGPAHRQVTHPHG